MSEIDLEIPPVAIRAVAALAKLRKDERRALSVAYSTGFESVGKLGAATEEFFGEEPGNARSVAVALVWLRHTARERQDCEIVARGLVRDSGAAAPEDRDELIDTFATLLKSKSVTLLSRATRLQLAGTSNFSGCETVTSSRPLFPNPAEDHWVTVDEAESMVPHGEVVVTELQFTHFGDETINHPLSLAMDLSDLKVLRDSVDRAIKKHSALIERIRASRGLAIVPLEGD